MKSVLALLLIVSIPAGATAERYQSTWFAFGNGNLSIPSGPAEFHNRWNPGVGGGLGAGLQVTPWVTVVAHADADFFALDEQALIEELNLDSATGGAVSIVHAYIGARAHVTYPEPETRFLPYLTAGFGIIRTREGHLDIVEQGSKTEFVTTTDISFAANAGFGVDIQATERIRFFTDIKAVLGFTDNEDTVYFPVRIGLSYKVSAGPFL